MTNRLASPAQARGSEQKRPGDVLRERGREVRRERPRHPAQDRTAKVNSQRGVTPRPTLPTLSNHRSAAGTSGTREPHKPTGANHRQAGATRGPRREPAHPGRPLPAALRLKLAPIVGSRAADAARIHTDAAANDRTVHDNVRAVTSGTDIFFAPGQYRPGTRDGDWLIAHEVAHVDQAQRGFLKRPAFKAVAYAEPTPLETAADRAADQVTQDAEKKKPAQTGSAARQGAAGGSLLTAVPGDGTQAAATPQRLQVPGDDAAAESAQAVAVTGEAQPQLSTAMVPPDLPLMPEPAAELSSAEQKRITGVQNRARATSTVTATAPAAEENVSTAQAAVQVPQSENDARAAEQVVADLSKKEKPSIEIVELCDRIRKLIEEKRPADEEGVIDTRPAEVAKEAGQSVESDVQKNVDDANASYGPIDTNPQGPPPAIPPAIEPIPAAAPTPTVGATAASPDAVPVDQANLDQDTQQMEAKAQNAGLHGDAAQLVTSGPVADAREAQGELNALAKDGPAEALKQQHAALAQSDADMAALQAKALASLKEARAGHVSGVKTQQDQLKGGEEDLRSKLSKKAADIYTDAQSRVQELLKAVPETAMRKWTAGLPPLTQKFNDELKVVKEEVEDRHSGVDGFFVAGWDAVTGLPDWVTEAYEASEKHFGDGVCTLITDISSYVNGIIKIADEIISVARSDINTVFTKDMPEDQKAWAAEQLKVFNKKLDALHDEAESTRTAFNKELIENAGGAVQAARERIQKLRMEAQGLWGRFLDAVGRFLDDPVKFIIEGLLDILGISPPAFWAVVEKVKQFVSDIVDAPIKFASNLMSGIADGFALFFDRIGKHLLEGLLEWLLSGLKQEGIAIEVPKELSLRNVVVFFLQLLGISWARIRTLLVEQLGEKSVALIEKSAGVIHTLAKKGLGGIFEDVKKLLEPKAIIDAIVDAAMKYIAEALIIKVAQKIILMLNPVGAILAALEAIYRVLKWIFQNAAKIVHLIEAVVNGLADVISGNVAGVAKTVEKALATLVAPVIDFLADYLGLGGLPGKVANAVKGLHGWVEGVLRSVIKWLVEMGKKLLAALGVQSKDDKKEPAGGVGERVSFSGGGESHALYFVEQGDNATLMVASTPVTVSERLVDFRGRATGAGGKLPFFSDDGERERALSLIATAATKATEADQDADKIVRQHRKQSVEAGSLESANQEVAQEQRSLVAILSDLYEMFGEHPGDDELDMRASYDGSIGSGEVSFKRKSEKGKTAYVMGSGPIVGRIPGARRGQVTLEAAALRAALRKQVLVPAPASLDGALPQLEGAAADTERIAKDKLKGKKVQPPPEALQQGLDNAASFASIVAAFKLVGGGEIVERAVSALAEDIKKGERGGVFSTVDEMKLEIARLTATARQAARSEDPTQPRSATRRFVPGRGLISSEESARPAVVIRKTGPEVSGLASYPELIKAIRKVSATFGPTLARAIHDVPVGRINATMDVTLRGREITKDQDKFLGEVALLISIEMVRAKVAWAFLVPQLMSAKSADEVAQAFSETVFPHAIKGFVAEYKKRGPQVFDAASAALLNRLAVEFEKKEGIRDGGQVFLDPTEIQSAVDVVKIKLRGIYDESVSKA